MTGATAPAVMRVGRTTGFSDPSPPTTSPRARLQAVPFVICLQPEVTGTVHVAGVMKSDQAEHQGIVILSGIAASMLKAIALA